MTYVNPTSVLGVGVTFIVLSVLATVARFTARLKNGLGVGVDDWLSIPATILTIGCCVVLIVGHSTGTIGTHSPPSGPEIFLTESPQFQITKKLETSFYFMQVPALLFLKLAVLFLYRRLFVGRSFTVAFWFLILFSTLWAITFFTAFASACGTNFNFLWVSPAPLRMECANTFLILLCQAVFDVVVDLGILILPIPFVWRLQMPIGRKLSALAMLLVGGLAIAFGFVRLVLVGNILGTPFLQDPTVVGLPSTDLVGVVSVLIFWGMLELGTGMVAISLPALAPLLRGATLESLVNGFRSLVSLVSVSSGSRGVRSGYRSRSGNAVHEDEDNWAPGQAGLELSSRESFVHATRVKPFGEHGPGDNEIYVQKSLSLSAKPTSQEV